MSERISHEIWIPADAYKLRPGLIDGILSKYHKTAYSAILETKQFLYFVDFEAYLGMEECNTLANSNVSFVSRSGSSYEYEPDTAVYINGGLQIYRSSTTVDMDHYVPVSFVNGKVVTNPEDLAQLEIFFDTIKRFADSYSLPDNRYFNRFFAPKKEG